MLARPIELRNPLQAHIREDIPGRFNEIYMLKQHWPRIVNTLQGNILPPYEIIIHPSSACNLCCVWCIGDHVPIESVNGDGIPVFLDAAKTNSHRLPDHLADPEKMLRVIQGIVDYKKVATYAQNGQEYTEEFKVENVSFSGLIGEPLASKRAVIAALQLLVDNQRRVGMFTNGVLMDESTLDTIVQIAYIHLSLDAGTGQTYGFLKFGGKTGGDKRFEKALENLKNLVHKRANTPNVNLAINSSFILYPENYHEVHQAARILKDIGVDTLRIKQDISGLRLLGSEQKKVARELLAKIRADLVDENFNLIEIHKLRDDEGKRTFSKCIITELMAAIGSDGNLYPCNYHPRPGGATYGSAIDIPFKEVWEGTKRRDIKQGIPHICPSVCDPFKNRSNQLLNTVHNVYHAEGVLQLESYSDELSVPLAQNL